MVNDGGSGDGRSRWVTNNTVTDAELEYRGRWRRERRVREGEREAGKLDEIFISLLS